MALDRTKLYQQQTTARNPYNNNVNRMAAGQLNNARMQSSNPLADAIESYNQSKQTTGFLDSLIHGKANDGMYQGVDLKGLDQFETFKGMSDNDKVHALMGNNGAIDPKALQQAVNDRMAMGNAMNGAQTAVNNGTTFLNNVNPSLTQAVQNGTNTINVNTVGGLASATAPATQAYVAAGVPAELAAEAAAMDSAVAGTTMAGTAAQGAAAGASSAAAGASAALPVIGAGAGVYLLGNLFGWWN